MKKTILDFRALMKVAHEEARQYLTDVLALLNELNGTDAQVIDIDRELAMGLVISPVRQGENGLPYGTSDYYYYIGVAPTGIWVVPQNEPEKKPEFFTWEDLDHENDVLGVAEFVQGQAIRLFRDPATVAQDAPDPWYVYQDRLGREVLKPKSIFE
jgi:hypothetical protein